MSEINWHELYQILGELTPLAGDCGLLCGKKCCSLREDGRGVYLFPGEEKLFVGETRWCRVEEHPREISYFTGRNSLILNCRGECPRDKRPLACRLFPLSPRLDQSGQLEIVFDADAMFICPLVRLGDREALVPAFWEAVQKVWQELIKHGPVRESVEVYSARVDGEAEEPWVRLFR